MSILGANVLGVNEIYTGPPGKWEFPSYLILNHDPSLAHSNLFANLLFFKVYTVII